MGWDKWGPSQRPRPTKPVSVVSVVADLDARQRQDDRRLPTRPIQNVTNVVAGEGGVLDTVTASSDGDTIEAELGTGLWIINASGTATLTATGSAQFDVHLTYSDPALGYSVATGTGPWSDDMTATSASLVYVSPDAGTYYVVPSGNYTTIDVLGLNFTAYRIA